ncbi:hypothetical protein CQ020_05835 [Arthrobacter sp. MYb23]|uniref:hypothetical protein n=1 Tax=Arthrobacter sp. MYb23 TaxID=1848603 RepID=UPI000CFD8869|nr:hypothetical protein [Arthrobacter sp. MYb23]PRB43014.1 hypothetical protein CQ038_08465 [Arthrobacter sp. MYb51]PRB97967.1 hypothetical protein CQ020_05835 [Arthrobacter sp. MYb23]
MALTNEPGRYVTIGLYDVFAYVHTGYHDSRSVFRGGFEYKRNGIIERIVQFRCIVDAHFNHPGRVVCIVALT